MGTGSKIKRLHHQVLQLGIHLDLLGWDLGGGVPESLAAAGDRQPREQPAHAVTDQDHPVEGRVFALGIELGTQVAQRLAKPRPRGQDRITRRVEKHPELIALAQLRIAAQVVHGVVPGLGTGHEPVHENHGDLSRLIGVDQVDPGPAVVLRGEEDTERTQQIQVGDVELTGQRDGHVVSKWKAGGVCCWPPVHRGVEHRVVQLEDCERFAGTGSRPENRRGRAVECFREVGLAGLGQCSRRLGRGLTPLSGSSEGHDHRRTNTPPAGLMAETLDFESAGRQGLFPPRRFIQPHPPLHADPRPCQELGPGNALDHRLSMGRLQRVLDGPPVNSLGSRGGIDIKPWRELLAQDVRQRLQGSIAVVRDRPFGMFLVQCHASLDERKRLGGRWCGTGCGFQRSAVEDWPIVDHDRGAATEYHRQGHDQRPDHPGHGPWRGAELVAWFEAPHLPSLGELLLRAAPPSVPRYSAG